MKFDIRCILPSSQTDGRIAVFAENVAPYSGPPLHAHRSQIEIFHIITGNFRFVCDGEEVRLSPGGVICIPAGAAHTFQNISSEPGLIHFELLNAGRSEDFFYRLCHEADRIQDFAGFFSEYDIDLLGPPLD